MPKNYVIRDQGAPSTFEGNYGKMISYRLTVAASGEPDQDVELVQKQETKAPQTGDVIYGHIEPARDPKYPPKLKKDKKENTGGYGGGNTNTRSGGGDRNQDSIERQVAFKGAVEIVTAMEPAGINAATLKATMTDLFNHGLGLIQGQTVSEVSPSSPPPPAPNPGDPGPTEPPPPPEEAQESFADPDTGQVPITVQHLRDAYRGFQNQEGPERANVQWKNKLTSMGLTSERLEEATHDQRVDLLTFLEDVPF